MKRGKLDSGISLSRLRSIQVLMIILFLYLLLMSLEMPLVFKTGLGVESPEDESTTQLYTTTSSTSRPIKMKNEDEQFVQKQDLHAQNARKMKEFKWVSGLVFDEIAFNSIDKKESSELHRAARDAFVVGRKVFKEIRSGKVNTELGMDNIRSYPAHKARVKKKDKWGVNNIKSYLVDKARKKEKDKKGINGNSDGNDERERIRARARAELTCPNLVILTGEELKEKGKMMEIPCGLMLGSHITVVGKPGWAHPEKDSRLVKVKDEESEMVSQFIMELQGLRTVDGEDPPRILHFNPRLKGDWNERPIIELNTCYRMQWGTPLRCEGWKSRDDEETVDGQVKCEKWIRDDDNNSEESKTTWWLKRLIGRKKKVTVDWPYPFAEDKLFVLTLSAGLEGYHVNVDGKHITSFPYRTGFTLEDATGLSLKGDVNVHSIFAASLPTSHPSFAPQKHLEMVTKWQAPPLPNGPVELFIGILSAGNHFAERMAVRKSWMQQPLIRSSETVTRFFVAMHGRKEVNVELMKEVEFFGDIVIVPYMDNYDLVVLKTVAICEYGVRTMAAKYIMKCDDDTFVRIDAVMKEVEKIHSGRSLYLGNINYYSKPLRHGKWTVTYEEWPEEDYPPYANGPGYVLSSDIARFIVSEFEKHKLRLFKMEDVSVGMWVEQFNSSRPVEYVHSLKFCQFGCIEDYYTAHYQSPRLMICLWRKLQLRGKAQCCNMR